MTQGVIIYVLGEKAPEGLQTGAYYPGLRQLTGILEVVVCQSGVLKLEADWQFLLSLGCDTIHLLVTTAEDDHLRQLYPLVHFTGVSRMVENPTTASWQRWVLH